MWNGCTLFAVSDQRRAVSRQRRRCRPENVDQRNDERLRPCSSTEGHCFCTTIIRRLLQRSRPVGRITSPVCMVMRHAWQESRIGLVVVTAQSVPPLYVIYMPDKVLHQSFWQPGPNHHSARDKKEDTCEANECTRINQSVNQYSFIKMVDRMQPETTQETHQEMRYPNVT